MSESDSKTSLHQLRSELDNFQDIAGNITPLPGEIPRLAGIHVFGDTIPLNGVVGGDHIIYVDFKQRYDMEARIRQAAADGRSDVVAHLERCRRMAGIALIDVAGHRATDALLAAMMHQAFLLGAIYELDMFGHITKHLFENLNTRFYDSSSVRKFVTMIYGEISEDFTFRFLTAAHPHPVVFSSEQDRFMEVHEDLAVTFPPIGTLPSQGLIDSGTRGSVLGFKDQYQLNEWKLMGEGDILLLYTDGLAEHTNGTEGYFPHHLERTLRDAKDRSARQIYDAITEDMMSFGKPSDDVSLVVLKRA